MTSRSSGTSGRLLVEAVAVGLAYAMTLLWLGVCALASFRPDFLSYPYWPRLPGLRSDTSAALAFFTAAVCLVVSEYLRLRRRGAAPAVRQAPNSPAALLAVAVAEMVAVLSTGLVIYISTNAITHPETLMVVTTHLAPWPTEGTLRVLALIACACSVAVLRYLLAGSTIWRGGRRPAVTSSGECTCGGGAHHEPAGDGSADMLPPISDSRIPSRVSPAAGSKVAEE